MSLIDNLKVSYGLLKQGHIKSAIVEIINPSDYRGELGIGGAYGGMWSFQDGQPDRLYTYVDKWSSLKAYTSCPPVAAIINKKAQAFVNGKTWITNTSGKWKGKESTNEAATKIKKLLLNPNKLQSGKQFEAQMYSLINLYGYCVILPIGKPFGYDNTEAKSFWILPNWLLDIYTSTDNFFDKDATVIKRVVFVYGGHRTELPVEELIIIKDFTPCLTSPVLPSNRIEPMAMPINNVIGAYESRNVLINKRGPTGFLTQENNPLGNIPLTEKEVNAMQADFKKYGLRKGQIQVILGMSALKWQKMGFDVNELRLMEEVTESSQAICNGLAYPPFLMGLSDTTFNNQKEASRGLYQETIIPESESIYQQWNTVFNTASYGICISKDYSHVAALQEDRLLTAQSRDAVDKALEREFKNNLITLNNWLSVLDYEPRTDGFGDMYYYQLLKLGWSFGNTTLNGGDTQATNGTGNAPMAIVN